MSEDQFSGLKNDEIIELIEEGTGQSRSFYIIDVFESEGARYAALQSIEEDFLYDDDDELEDYDEDEEFFEEGEMLLLRIDENPEGEVLVGIEEDTEFERVRQIFEARLEGEA